MISFKSSVRKLEQRRRLLSAYKLDDGTVQSTEEELGWFLVIEGMGVAISCGKEKPSFNVGDQVKLTISVAPPEEHLSPVIGLLPPMK
jgi:hypothetical protein